jgi:hypothetical protein
MIIGQLGITTVIFSWKTKQENFKVSYLVEKVRVG